MTTLENFYYGNIIPHENPIIKGSDYDVANRLVVRHDETLTATLTEQQKETFQKFKDNYLELLTLGERVYPRVFSWHQNRSRGTELRQNLIRPNSPRVARNKKSGNYPTSPDKADTGDLSRFVGAEKHRLTECQAVLWVSPKFCVNSKSRCKIEQKYYSGA